MIIPLALFHTGSTDQIKSPFPDKPPNTVNVLNCGIYFHRMSARPKISSITKNAYNISENI